MPSSGNAIEGFQVKDCISMRNYLKEKLQYDASLAEEFLDGLANFLADNTNLYRSLLESMPYTPSSSSLSQEFSQSSSSRLQTSRVSVSLNNDSLIKLLLKIPVLQPKILRNLLEKLPEFSCGDSMEVDNDKHSVSQDDLNLKLIPKLILHQLRWMDFFVEGGNLSQELLSCLDVCDRALKLDIIGLLPEIISDAESGNIVEKLMDLMSEVVTLTQYTSLLC